ncbi:uncharacterized protein [Dermacentor andersoni]|uniref:uncharacterized protein n=1 Tax=Dermacentor andersoni TaxID=34620 RepID=UPI0024169FBC|nr:uncharacterized protein LOC126538728 [Dermacentor andersoni]
MSGSMHSDFCEVYLCAAPIQNTGSTSANMLSYFASASRSLCGNSWEKHWLVIFDYGEDAVLVCDADMDHAGDLAGRKCWKKRTVLEETYSYKRHLGRHCVPKARIEEVVLEMCDSGRYHLTDNNCQKWVKELLGRLDIQMPSDERDAQAVVEGVVQPAVGASLIGGGIALSF